MAAPKGNQFWKAGFPGRPRIFETPEELWIAAEKYFAECDSSPLLTTETTDSEKGVFTKTAEHRIPYTWQGLYVHLGISDLRDYKEQEVFSRIITHIGNIIYNQKYSGAAAGIFNANIIARDLGLADKKEVTQDLSVKKAEDLSDSELAAIATGSSEGTA